MNNIPKDLDLSGLIGQTVEQVCFGLHQVIVHLSESLCISFESGVSFAGHPSISVDRDDLIAGNYHCFIGLLGKTVQKADVISESTLEIDFSNGAKMRLCNDNENYECFQIKLPRVLVVI